MQTLVHENSKLELNPLRRSQPVQLAEERSDVVVPRRGEHESRHRVHDRLELLEKVRWNASRVVLPYSPVETGLRKKHPTGGS